MADTTTALDPGATLGHDRVEAGTSGAAPARGVSAAPGRRGVDSQLWRGLSLLRVLALAWAAVQYAFVSSDYEHPVRGWAVIGGMAVWTLVVAPVYLRGRVPLGWLAADTAVSCAALFLAGSADVAAVVADRSLPAIWAAVPVLGWSVALGAWAGLAAAGLEALVMGITREALSATVVNNAVLLALAAIVIAWIAQVARRAERDRAVAAELRAREVERRRLGRVVHDGVLQVLAQVAHRGPDLGPDGVLLAQAAAAQEAALRALVASEGITPDHDDEAEEESATTDLAAALAALGSSTVTVSPPAGAVLVDAGRGREIVAAVQAALDNVAAHAGEGARAWVLLDDTGAEVRVTIRDDGTGFGAGRLAQAHADGRMGVAGSIVGRIRDLGGEATVVGRPGEGVEVELVVPRATEAGSVPGGRRQP